MVIELSGVQFGLPNHMRDLKIRASSILKSQVSYQHCTTQSSITTLFITPILKSQFFVNINIYETQFLKKKREFETLLRWAKKSMRFRAKKNSDFKMGVIIGFKSITY